MRKASVTEELKKATRAMLRDQRATSLRDADGRLCYLVGWMEKDFPAVSALLETIRTGVAKE